MHLTHNKIFATQQ